MTNSNILLHTVSLRLSAEDYVRLSTLAHSQGTSVGRCARMVIKKVIANVR